MIGLLLKISPWSFKLKIYERLLTSEKDEYYLYYILKQVQFQIFSWEIPIFVEEIDE